MASFSKKLKTAEEESNRGPNWLELPRDLTSNILQRLGVVEIVTSVCLVCPLWWNICKDPLMWRTIQIPNPSTSRYDLQKICIYAVGRSCGQVEDIDIEYFCDDDLLQYIAESTSCLRRLRIAKCWNGISNIGMSKVAKKLPLLEELDISENIIFSDTLELIGRCCPLLKSLKIVSELNCLDGCDEDALAVAKSMSGLHRLKISGKLLTDVGVLAILDGCPLLQSLDFTDIHRLVLSDSSRTRCHEQIKDLLLPSVTYFLDDDCYSDTDSDDLSEDSFPICPWESLDNLDYWDYTDHNLFI